MAFVVGVGFDGDVRHPLNLLGQHAQVGDACLARLQHALLVAFQQTQVCLVGMVAMPCGSR